MCNVRAIRYKRILFFYGLPRRGSFRSLRLRLRQCFLWCRELSMLPRTLVFARFLGVWCRVLFTCCHAPWCHTRGQMVLSSLRGAAHSMVPRSCMLPRTSVTVVRPRTCMPPCIHGAARLCAAAQFHVLPRTHGATRGTTLHRLRVSAHLYTLPRSSTCFRAPWCRPRHNALSLRLCCRAVVWIAVKGRLVPQSASIRLLDADLNGRIACATTQRIYRDKGIHEIFAVSVFSSCDIDSILFCFLHFILVSCLCVYHSDLNLVATLLQIFVSKLINLISSLIKQPL